MSNEDAATLGISIATVVSIRPSPSSPLHLCLLPDLKGQCLYRVLELPLPTEPVNASNEYILIYGGSTATGIYGIQFAKLSGLKVITTASPHNFEYLKSLGADAVFDYKSPSAANDIRKLTNNSLKLAWDCTGYGIPIAAGALSSEGGKYVSIVRVKREDIMAINPNVDGPHITSMYTIFGERVSKLNEIPPIPEEYKFAKKFWELARQLLEENKLHAPRTFVNRGGASFEGILKGLDELRANKVSGGKLVYTL